MLSVLLSRPDTKWVLTAFSVMGFLNLASRMAGVYTGAGLFAVGLAFIGIGGWIHGIASIARSAQTDQSRRDLTLLLLAFFPLGCALAFPWHFFAFNDVPGRHPVIYVLAQTLLAFAYFASRTVLTRKRYAWYIRHAILGYATFACIFQSVSPKVATNWLGHAIGMNLTTAFAGSTGLIIAIIATDILCAMGTAAARVHKIGRKAAPASESSETVPSPGQ